MTLKGYKTLGEAVESLRRRGFAENFELANQTFQAVDSGKTFTAGEVTIVEHHRFEGASDPDDMAVLYAIETAAAHAEPSPMRLGPKPTRNSVHFSRM